MKPSVLLLSLTALAASCRPPAQILRIDTDVTDRGESVVLNRLRIDTFEVLHDPVGLGAAELSWLETNEYPLRTTQPETVALKVDEPRELLLRVRAFHEGRVRLYGSKHGRPGVGPTLPSETRTLAALEGPPQMAIGETVTLRLTHSRPTPWWIEDTPCTAGSTTGPGDAISFTSLGAVAVSVPRADGACHLLNVDTIPGDEADGLGLKTLVMLRRSSAPASLECYTLEAGQPISIEDGCTQNPHLPVGPVDRAAEEQITIIVGRYGRPLGSGSDVRITVSPSTGSFERPQIARDPEATPPTEPEPGLAIDQLVRLRGDGRNQTVTAMLRGVCLGVEADLSHERSCNSLGVLDQVARDTSSLRIPRAAAMRTWPDNVADCPSAPADEGLESRVCLRGGVVALDDVPLPRTDAEPSGERLAFVRTLTIDRYEVTVGRFRRVWAVHPAELGAVDLTGSVGLPAEHCLWTPTPGDPIDEEAPINCVPWQTAERFCAVEGGSLPTIAQWRLASAGLAGKNPRRYPWGGAPPSCSEVVYGRLASSSSDCLLDLAGRDPGPISVRAAMGDRTPDGVFGLAGNVAEWTLDSYQTYQDPCWLTKTSLELGCSDAGSPARSIMGGSWADPRSYLQLGIRRAHDPEGAPGDDRVGFRCVYPPHVLGPGRVP